MFGNGVRIYVNPLSRMFCVGDRVDMMLSIALYLHVTDTILILIISTQVLGWPLVSINDLKVNKNVISFIPSSDISNTTSRRDCVLSIRLLIAKYFPCKY